MNDDKLNEIFSNFIDNDKFKAIYVVKITRSYLSYICKFKGPAA